MAGRAHVRGGRDHFTARKFDQIPGRLDTFGDFLTKIIRFEVFSRLVFYLVFKSVGDFNFCFRILVDCFHFNNLFSNFWRFKTRNFGQKSPDGLT